MQTYAVVLLTFRELWAKKITLGLFLVCTLAWIVLSMALNLDVVEGSLAGIRIFGQTADPTEVVRDPKTGEMVRQAVTLQGFVLGMNRLVGGAAYILGTLLGLFATAPLAVSMMESGRIDLLISKPLSRSRILAGYVLGVWLTALALSVYLIFATWLVMSMKTGIWDPTFLLAIPIIVAMFAVMYAVVIFLSVTTQSSALALVVAYGLIFVSFVFLWKEQLLPQIDPPWRGVFIGLYNILPNFLEVVPIVAKLTGSAPVASWYPLWSSLAFGSVLYSGSFFWFNHRDF